MSDNISIIGAGSWGTTLAIVLSKKGINVHLHSVFKEHNLHMLKLRENTSFLKGVKFPPNLKINLSLKDSLNNPIIVIAIPVKFLRKVVKRIKGQKVPLDDKIFVSVSKGIEVGSLKTASQIIREEIDKCKIAVLSGPNISKEVLENIPTVTVIASENESIARKLQNIFTNPMFRVYIHRDVIGVEIGGALKNIIAIAAGISDGLGFGTNTKAALLTRGLVEITRLAEKLGAFPSTIWGISGLGDLATTCFSPHSRNRFVGEQIAKGKSLKDVIREMKMVAEGVETVKSAFNLSKKLNVDMPITREVFLVLYKNKSPKKAVEDLMKRPLIEESIIENN
ncbi:MAG: NAD(P)-dependent glycerol-3-phosphate dehydrogenase [Candidatus Omnitrophica bacterium]|nr:NAD(P)-dependent glycerol-3-phosphate dehydrogenase [Candidatus Omnitrophota bacterium]